MFCAKCGAQNDEHSLFCCQCGAQLTEPVPVEPETPVVPVEAEIPAEAPETVSEMPTRRVRRKRSKKGLWIGLGATGGVLAIIAMAMSIVMVLTLVFGIVIAANFSTPEATVNRFMKAGLKPNSSKMYNCFHDKLLDDRYESKSDLKEQCEKRDEYIQDVYDMLDNRYNKWSVEYEIDYIEDMPEQNLKYIQKRYKDQYNLNVKQAKFAKIIVYFEADGNIYERSTALVLIKISGKWYVEPTSDPVSIIITSIPRLTEKNN